MLTWVPVSLCSRHGVSRGKTVTILLLQLQLLLLLSLASCYRTFAALRRNSIPETTISVLSAPQVAWKGHLHMLHPSPALYAAFMGDVAMWTGIVTGSLMLTSPLLFDRFGWRGVAGATPRFMIATGVRLRLRLALNLTLLGVPILSCNDGAVRALPSIRLC